MAILIILASIVYSAWKQVSFSIIASVACVAVIILSIVGQQLDSAIADDLAFRPHDLTDPSRAYSLLTSMFMHAGFTHLFMNLLMLVLVGLIFEQRIGTRPFIVLYLLAGLCGTLAFAALRWNDPFVPVVGASGAIMGILAGFARLYPNEKMMFFFLPVPLSVWTVVLILVLMQLVFVFTDARVAVEAHLGGLAAGIFLAPLVARLPLRQKTSSGRGRIQTLNIEHVRRLAVTPQLKDIMDRIEHEEVAEVRSAWIDDFLSKAKCPQCGSRLKAEKGDIVCEKGHIV